MNARHRADRVAALLLAIALLAPSAGGAQNFGGGCPEERYFPIESESARAADGRTVVRGYVSNTHYRAAWNVSLLIEGLDGSGRAVSKAVARVNGDVSAGRAQYSGAVAPAPGTKFRATVLSYDLVPEGGGGGP